MDLLEPREKPRFGWPEALALFVYCVLLFWTIANHESWFDEAQAWLIARDSTLWDLFVHRLHYEGAPALWHLLLWIEIRLHVSFLGMHYITGLLSAAGIYIWLRFNPLPRPLSLLFPFTFFLLYQYAVIARSYNLFPLFAFALMAIYQNKKGHPMLFCVVAGLLVNCSLHMAAFAVGMVLCYGWNRRQAARQNHIPLNYRQYAAPLCVFLIFCSLAIATAWPTPDGTFGGKVVQAAAHVTSHGGSSAAQTDPFAAANDAQDNETPPAGQGYIASKIWHAIHLPAGAGHRALLVSKLLRKGLRILSAITSPISTWNSLALVFLLLLGINLWLEHELPVLVPYVLIFLACCAIDVESHHTGLLWIALICALWVLSLQPARGGAAGFLRTALYAVTLLIMVLQIQWSYHCVSGDIRGAYAGDEATAAFLRQLPPGKRIAAFDIGSVTVNAYLSRSPYFNQHVDYWPFSKVSNPDLDIDKVLAQKPDIIINEQAFYGDPFYNQWVTIDTPGLLEPDPVTQRIDQDGYHETHRFCGQHFFRNSSEATECRVIYEPVSAVTAPGR